MRPRRFVYILRSLNDPERHYVGLTSHVDARLVWHNAGLNAHTARDRPWQLVLSMEFRDETAALQDLTTYAWLASVMWVPTVAAWTVAWNRWCLRPWRSIDVSAVVLAVAGIIGAVIHSATVTSGSRLGSIALFVVTGARIVRSGPVRILALVTLASIMAGLFGGELLDTIGVPGIWFQTIR